MKHLFVVVILFGIVACDSKQQTQPVEKLPEVQATQAPENANLTITSDPTGAEVFLGTVSKGFTPLSVGVTQGKDTEYTVVAKEPNELYDLYKPYVGTFNISQDETISVWLERTTADEQQEQQLAFKARRLEGLESDIAIACERVVEKSLKAPRTAKFAGIFSGAQTYRYDADTGVAVYASYVDAENGFGAMLRNNFACSYKLSDNAVKLEYLR